MICPMRSHIFSATLTQPAVVLVLSPTSGVERGRRCLGPLGYCWPPTASTTRSEWRNEIVFFFFLNVFRIVERVRKVSSVKVFEGGTLETYHPEAILEVLFRDLKRFVLST